MNSVKTSKSGGYYNYILPSEKIVLISTTHQRAKLISLTNDSIFPFFINSFPILDDIYLDAYLDTSADYEIPCNEVISFCNADIINTKANVCVWMKHVFSIYTFPCKTKDNIVTDLASSLWYQLKEALVLRDSWKIAYKSLGILVVNIWLFLWNESPAVGAFLNNTIKEMKWNECYLSQGYVRLHGTGDITEKYRMSTENPLPLLLFNLSLPPSPALC